MITACLIFRLSQPNLALQFLCVMELCLGVAILFRGLRLRRIRANVLPSPHPTPWKTNGSFLQHIKQDIPDPIEEIIRLSPDPVSMKSAEMTQQQKIAAALARAGTSHSASWLHESTAVATEPDPSEQETTTVREVHSAPLTPQPKFANISQLLIWSGLALALLSCYLLVTIR